MRKIVIASLASAALVLGSTAAAAAKPIPAAQAPMPSGWTMLTALSSTPGAALGGTAVAAQPADTAYDDDDGLGINGEVVGILVVFALIIAALLLIDDGSGEGVSPD
jgi:hypothetical protein